MGDHKEPPKTIREVGIIIGFMSDDIRDLKELVEKMPAGFATKTELAAVTTRILRLEAKSVWRDVALVATTLLSIFGLYNYFTGGK